MVGSGSWMSWKSDWGVPSKVRQRFGETMASAHAWALDSRTV